MAKFNPIWTGLFSNLKARSHDPILRIRFLVPKIGSRCSDGPISSFRFCGENVGRSFVVCSHDPIFRTNKESSIWRQNDHRDIMPNLLAPFIFQKEWRMKIEHVLFPSIFAKLRIRVSEGNFQCVHTIRFSEPTKIGSLKTDRVNGPLKRLGGMAPPNLAISSQMMMKLGMDIHVSKSFLIGKKHWWRQCHFNVMTSTSFWCVATTKKWKIFVISLFHYAFS